MKRIFEFIVKMQWNKQLDGNKKLARKILDTLKIFEKPEFSKQMSEKDSMMNLSRKSEDRIIEDYFDLKQQAPMFDLTTNTTSHR